MQNLAQRGIDPRVVDDQTGRLTFTPTLAEGIHHLLTTHAPHGTYNLTGTGEPHTWADIARTVYTLTGHDPARITGVTTTDYYSTAEHATAPRPHNSTLDTTKIENTGYTPTDAIASLRSFLADTAQ